jgi:hypothetical protein
MKAEGKERRVTGTNDKMLDHLLSPSPCLSISVLAFFHPSAFILHPFAWRSELESNQPIGLFRPALIHLSYPTRGIADLRFSIADLSLGLRT